MHSLSTEAGKLPEFDNHKEVIRLENKELGVVGFVAIHSKRGQFPSLGATRVWDYLSEEEALRDALRLSRLMSHKSVFAGLPYGGAKATLRVSKKNPPKREQLFSWYAKKLNDLEGRFITGSDVGVLEEDVSYMAEYTPFVIGSHVPAALYTAVGVQHGIEVAIENLTGSEDLSGKSFAVQGLGKTGMELVKLLYGKAAGVFVSDIDELKLKEAGSAFPKVKIVSPEKIYTQKVDVFSPCALNHSINNATMDLLHSRAIVGSANNQMESSAVEAEIYKKGILYAVDYIVNNGGLISVVDEYENKTHNEERILKKLLDTKIKLKEVFKESTASGLSPAVVADRYVAKVLYPDVAYELS